MFLVNLSCRIVNYCWYIFLEMLGHPVRRACPFKKPQIVIKYEVAEVPNPKLAAASNF